MKTTIIAVILCNAFSIAATHEDEAVYRASQIAAQSSISSTNTRTITQTLPSRSSRTDAFIRDRAQKDRQAMR